MQIKFEYTFLEHSQIISTIPKISELEGSMIFEMGLWIMSFIIMSFILFPLIHLRKIERKKEIDKINKKLLLQRLILQKEIEEEVQKEISLDDEKKFQK